jgi:hypothetical protein
LNVAVFLLNPGFLVCEKFGQVRFRFLDDLPVLGEDVAKFLLKNNFVLLGDCTGRYECVSRDIAPTPSTYLPFVELVKDAT